MTLRTIAITLLALASVALLFTPVGPLVPFPLAYACWWWLISPYPGAR